MVIRKLSAHARDRPRVALIGLIGCGAGITLLLGSQARVPDLLARSSRSLAPAHEYLAALGASFLLYLLAIRLARSVRAQSPGDRPRAARPRLLTVVGAGALAMRLVLLPAPPTLTTDYLRYLWDGRVARHGVNPYRYPPDAASLRDLRFPGWERINYPGTRTPYPPLAEVTFWLNAALLGDSILGLKLLFTACDLTTAWLLLRLLRTLGRPDSDVLIYAWHPLVVTETALSAHVDAQGLLLLVVALWLLGPRGGRREAARGSQLAARAARAPRTFRASEPRAASREAGRRLGARSSRLKAPTRTPNAEHRTPEPRAPSPEPPCRQRLGLAGVALGSSVAVKSFPVLYLPAMVGRRGWRLFWTTAGTVTAFYLPFLLTGAPLQGGAQAMAAYWVSNASLYPVIERLAGLLLSGMPGAARSAARFLVGMLVLAAALIVARNDRKTMPEAAGATEFEDLASDLFAVTMVLFLLSPVVMPWYLVWLVPFLLLRPFPSGFAFTALVPLAYLIPAHRWVWWVAWAEYLPVYLLFAAERLKGRRGRP
jgi:hypothetical protein